MKIHPRVLIATAATCLALAPGIAVAQTGGNPDSQHRRGGHAFAERGGEGGHHGPSRAGHRGMRALEALDLSESQRSAVKEIFEASREQGEPRREEAREIHRQIRELEAAESPDAEALGTLMLEARAIREEMKAEHESIKESIRSLLTEEQAAKFDLLQEMGEDRRSDRRDRHHDRSSGKS
ncbi:MAG: Spy/CpxP family protein refolding chaperone [Thermoanaerobaculia bacterium]|nr:Spy/CpxP family protein refolding chaperone [Thermoanaerobaculia bacterium]